MTTEEGPSDENWAWKTDVPIGVFNNYIAARRWSKAVATVHARRKRQHMQFVRRLIRHVGSATQE